MAGRDYERLSIEDFGKHLLRANDLDPIYVGLRGAELDRDQKRRWAIAYWCFYHAGLASFTSERTGHDFWDVLIEAARNTTVSPVGERWPRGHERRHARGMQGEKMILDLRRAYDDKPEDMFRFLTDGPNEFASLSKRVKSHHLFGPWISFKVADMLDRIFEYEVDFSEAEVFMFDDPVKAAIMLWRERGGYSENVKPKSAEAQKQIIHEIVGYLEEVFEDFMAPPLYDRGVRLQEVETVLCKWKSHMNGHYPLYNDIDEINQGLEAWGEVSSAARAFAEAAPTRENNRWPD